MVVTDIACSVNKSTEKTTSKKSNLLYTSCITPKRVTSLLGPSPQHCAWATQFLSKKSRNGGEAIGKSVFDLTGPEFEPLTSRTKAESTLTA